MIVKEILEFVVIEFFLYDWPDIRESRKLIPKHYELNGECKICLLGNRRILIKASCSEDYVNLLLLLTFYLIHRSWSYPMKILK